MKAAKQSGVALVITLLMLSVITFLAVCGLTHRTSYKDIFAITLIKTSAVFVVIAAYYLFHIV